MQKAKVLAAYSLDNAAYVGTCKAISLSDPESLTGKQLADFDKVRGWLDDKTCANFKEAAAKYQAWEVEQEDDEVELPPELLAIAEKSGADAIDTLPDITRQQATAMQQAWVKAFQKGAIAKMADPAFREQIEDALYVENVEDLALPGENQGFPALLPQ